MQRNFRSALHRLYFLPKQCNSFSFHFFGYVLKIFIKYMVSIRCKMVVKSELEALGLHYGAVDLGEVEVRELITAEQREHLKNALLKSGLELLDDKKAILIEKIKNCIVEMIHYQDEVPKIKHSDYLHEKLDHDYTYLANLFSEATGITIEQYVISHKIERVKELLLYDELNLTEISYKLNYSSVAHLSNQFKKVTGLTPSYFKKIRQKRLTNLENVLEEESRREEPRREEPRREEPRRELNGRIWENV
jgi:AraC-like DNA-binding protein